MNHGNTVVLTYNQFIDSRGFFLLMENDIYRESLITLFKEGSIKISQYNDVRTLSQYLYNSVDKDKPFIYSALPVKGTQKRLTALMKRSLMYSDLSEIYEYTKDYENKYGRLHTLEELRDLFIEVQEQDDGSTILKQSDLSIPEMQNILWKLYHMLGTTMRLSPMHQIYMHPKDRSEYQNYSMHEILAFVSQFQYDAKLPENMNPDPDYWQKAVCLVKGKNMDDRSPYLKELRDMLTSVTPKEEQNVLAYAEVIVDIAYNYACELSIANISKHYNVTDLECDPSEDTSFRRDFFQRLNQLWDHGQHNERFLQEETNDLQPLNGITSDHLPKNYPHFENIVQVNHYLAERQDEQFQASGIPRYESDLKEQVKEQKRSIHHALRKHALYLVTAAGLILITQFISDALGSLIELLPYLPVFCKRGFPGIAKDNG